MKTILEKVAMRNGKRIDCLCDTLEFNSKQKAFQFLKNFADDKVFRAVGKLTWNEEKNRLVFTVGASTFTWTISQQ